MWVEFLAEFWWQAKPQSRIRYRAGCIMMVTRACAQAAIAAGTARKVKNPKARDAANDASE